MGKRNGRHHSEWRKRQIMLPEGLVEKLFEWHGGQSTAVYALASTGMRDLVSLSMIDAAKEELDKDRSRVRGQKEKRELAATVTGLDEVRHFWREHSAQEAGMDVEEYEYDRANYGLTAEEEAAISTKSG